MRRKAVLAAALFAAFTTSAQAEDEVKKTEQLCADLAMTNAAINNFQNPRSDSTVAEAKAAEERVSDAIDYSSEAEVDIPVLDEGNGLVRVRFRPGAVRFRTE